MNTFTARNSKCCLPKQTRKPFIMVLFLSIGLTHNVFSQQSNLACNDITPWVNTSFTLTETNTATPLSGWVNTGNVINSNTSDFATATILVSGSVSLKVSDAANDYDAGNFAGFLVESGLLNTGVFDGISINTYLGGVLQETYDAIDLITLDLNLFGDPFIVGFITSTSYDEVEIVITNPLGVVTSFDVYYVSMEQFCAGPNLECNLQTALNNPDYPTIIDYLNTGSDGITIGNVGTPQDAVSASTTDYASLNNLAGADGSTFITIAEQVTDYPAGTFVGFDIENLNILSTGLLDYITITTYRDGLQKQTKSGVDLFLSANALSGGRQIVGFVSDSSVDKVKFSINQPLGINLGTTRVYNVVFETFCAGPELDCNMPQAITSPDYPLLIVGERTGITGVACALCSVSDAGNVIDEDNTNYAQINITSGVANIGSLSVKDQLTDYPADIFVGFRIENPNLVDVDALTGITVSTYLDGVLQETATNADVLVSVSSDLVLNDDQQVVGFVTGSPFDEVTISLYNVGSFDIGTTFVYELLLNEFCPADIICDSTYFLLAPEFPVYIDAFRTGVDGLACTLCEVTDEQNVITADTSDYGTITITAGVSGTASIAVADALYTYPPGTIAGFVIKDLGFLLQADLFQTLTISTYNDGVFQESKTGGELLEAALIVLFINPSSGVHNVGFETTLPFDEIRITVGALSGAINQIRVYGAFVDTNFSDGGSLLCDSHPVAVNDIVSTDEDTPLSGSVNANDTPSSDGGNVWSLLGANGGAVNGTVTMNPDGSYTYTPTPDFNGADSFSYTICDLDSDCDTAVVSITVNPINDLPIASDDLVTGNEDVPIMSDVQSNDTPSGDGDNTWSLVGIDGGALHGEVTMGLDGTYTYTPDPNYNGPDMFTYELCDFNGDCDQATVSITVGPIDDLPVASDDSFSGQQDMPLMENVQTNDLPSGDGGNAWTLVGTDGGALHGTVVMNPDGSFTYTPDPEYNGPDAFTYEICDVDADCDQATVSVFIEPVLPIKLLSFNAKRIGNSARLEWTTAYESNVDYFEIQKAGAGKDFTSIGKERAAGNSTAVQSYQFTDAAPFSGINYYRLKEVDFDGQSTYSPIQSLPFDTRFAIIKMWPNPASEGFYIATDDANHQGFEIDLVNFEGVHFLHQTIGENVTQTWVDLEHIPPGVYQLKLTGDGWQQSEKIVKVQ